MWKQFNVPQMINGFWKCDIYIVFVISWISYICCIQLCYSWTVACQAPLSMGFPRIDYLNGLPFPSLGDLPDPNIKPTSPALAGGCFTTESPGKPCGIYIQWNIIQYWCMLHHGWALKILYSVKKARHKRHIAWFHLYEIPGIGKSPDAESRLVVAMG